MTDENSVTNTLPENATYNDYKVWIGITIFTIIFAAIYEHFSFGVYSNAMIFMFVYPLLLGLAPSLIMKIKNLGRLPVFWNDGVICLTIGSLLKGVFEIYGTESSYVKFFYIIGAILLIIGGVMYFMELKKTKSEAKPVNNAEIHT